MNLSGTKTEENLRHAFGVECQAHLKYTFYQNQAVTDGYHNISLTLKEIANNEKAHAKIWFKLLHNNKIPETLENLTDSSVGEHAEWSSMYADFAKVAEEEGFSNIADLFHGVATIEKQHEQQFLQTAKDLKNNQICQKPKVTEWKCGNCGHIHNGTESPTTCPVCSHPQGWFIDMSLGI